MTDQPTAPRDIAEIRADEQAAVDRHLDKTCPVRCALPAGHEERPHYMWIDFEAGDGRVPIYLSEAAASVPAVPAEPYQAEHPGECGWVGRFGWLNEQDRPRPCNLPDDHEGKHARRPEPGEGDAGWWERQAYQQAARAERAEAAAPADDRLRFHPLTGDADFEEASLSDRLDAIISHARSEGFGEGYRAAAPAAGLLLQRAMTEHQREVVDAANQRHGISDARHKCAPICAEAIAERLAATPSPDPELLDVERLAQALNNVRPYGGNPSAWAKVAAEQIAAEYLSLSRREEPI